MSNTVNSIRYTQDRVSKLRKASSELGELGTEMPSSRLNPAEMQSLAEFKRWLQGAREQIDDLANQWETEAESVLRSPDLLARTNRTFEIKVGSLQNELQRQLQLIQTMSTLSKVLHDTAILVIRKIG